MTDYQLSDSDRAEADRLNAAEGVVWREKAKYIAERLARADTDAPLTARYQSCAYALRLGLSTARLYVRLETAFGAVLDECRTPDGDEIAGPHQLRQIYTEAARLKIAPDEALIRRIRESDQWGGQVAPPDVIAAQSKPQRAVVDPLTRALNSARRSLSSAARRMTNRGDVILVESWVKRIESWTEGKSNEAR